jgi:HPt (histidine-containing phosphotransfer) domain-containing protein
MSPLPDDPVEHGLRQKLLARTRDDVDEMRSAAQAREFPVVVRLAHRLAGAAGALGFDALCDAARALQLEGARGDGAQVHARLDEVAAELERAGRLAACP